jgi:hypothetical protein
MRISQNVHLGPQQIFTSRFTFSKTFSFLHLTRISTFRGVFSVFIYSRCGSVQYLKEKHCSTCRYVHHVIKLIFVNYTGR